MSAGLPSDFDQFHDFVIHELDSFTGAESQSLEDAVKLFRGHQRQTQERDGRNATAVERSTAKHIEKHHAQDRSIFRRLRETYVAEGGKLLTLDEIEQEVAERRGERRGPAYPRLMRFMSLRQCRVGPMNCVLRNSLQSPSSG